MLPERARRARIGFPDSVDYLGLAEDLIVLQPAAGRANRTAYVDTARQPAAHAAVVLRSAARTARDETLFRGAVIGHFVTTGATPEYADLVAIAPPTPRSANPRQGTPSRRGACRARPMASTRPPRRASASMVSPIAR